MAIRDRLRSIPHEVYAWFLGLFPWRGTKTGPSGAFPPDSEDKPEQIKPKSKKAGAAAGREVERAGRFYFTDTILNQLDVYFPYIERMKAGDRESYDLYSQLGAHILPLAALNDGRNNEWHRTELSPWWKKHRPAFGCVAYGTDRWTEEQEKETVERKGEILERWIPKFMHFRKYSLPPSDIQPCNGHNIYVMTIYWDKRSHAKKRKGGVSQEYPVAISPDGDVRVLLTREVDAVRVPTKRRKDGGEFVPRKWRNGHSIPRTTWKIADTFVEWARLHEKDPAQFLRSLFIEAANLYEVANSSMVRIAATKRGLTAVFGIDIKRSSYFFKDRDETIGESGAKKKIFHIVRPHMRTKLSGFVPVRMHFRGERRFTWNGYSIEITVPGRDHFMLNEFDLGMMDEGHPDVPKGLDMVGLKGMAKMMAKYIQEGKGGTVKRTGPTVH